MSIIYASNRKEYIVNKLGLGENFDFICPKCLLIKKKREFHFHHITYLPGIIHSIVLCEDCHSIQTKMTQLMVSVRNPKPKKLENNRRIFIFNEFINTNKYNNLLNINAKGLGRKLEEEYMFVTNNGNNNIDVILDKIDIKKIISKESFNGFNPLCDGVIYYGRKYITKKQLILKKIEMLCKGECEYL